MGSTSMIADEQTDELFRLFLVVRGKGGYDAVSRNDLWDLVAKESGLGSIISSTVKVLYIKYLTFLERWLEKIVENEDSIRGFSRNGRDADFGENVIESQNGFNGLLSDVEYLKKTDEWHEHTKLTHTLKFCDRDDDVVDVKINRNKNNTGYGENLCNSRKGEVGIHDINDLCNGQDPSLKFKSNLDKNYIDVEELCSLNFRESEGLTEDQVEGTVENLNGGRTCDNFDFKNDDGMILDFTSVKEQNLSHEKKHESMLGMINWITQIARDPCGPATGLLPELSKWKSFGNDEIWKQVLLFREAMLLKRHTNSSAVHSASQKIHPCMFDDRQGSSYNLRERLSTKILPSGKSMSQALSEMGSSLNLKLGMEDQDMLVTIDSWMPDYMGNSPSKHIPLGPIFQVEVSDRTNTESESDPKWLGTVVWPLDKVYQVSPIEHDHIGMGRQDSCECQVPGSAECIRHHITVKRNNVKMELGPAFNQWKFDRMGEEVALCWTKKEEGKFKDAVRSSSASLTESFWPRISDIFSYKSREDLVCYYFNVFLLRCRGFQNRFTPDKICSDDDELELETEKS